MLYVRVVYVGFGVGFFQYSVEYSPVALMVGRLSGCLAEVAAKSLKVVIL